MAKKKSGSRGTIAKRTTQTKKPASNGSDCCLTAAGTNAIAHFSKGLDHNPTTGEVIDSQFQQIVSHIKKLNANPATAAKPGLQLRNNTSASLSRFVDRAGRSTRTSRTPAAT